MCTGTSQYVPCDPLRPNQKNGPRARLNTFDFCIIVCFPNILRSIHHPTLAAAVAGYPQAPIELGEMVLAGESTVLEISLGAPRAESQNRNNHVNPDLFCPS